MPDEDIRPENPEENDEHRAHQSEQGQSGEPDDKALPSARGASSEADDNDKALPSARRKDEQQGGEKELPQAGERREEAERAEEQKAQPEEKPGTLAGDSLKDRIREITTSGGLKKLPPGFDDDKGDWQCIKSDNVFERLYLDWRQYQDITPAMVEKHYRILREFWDEKCTLMSQGANRQRFKKKYGPEIENYPRQLSLAYKQLMAPDGIENSFLQRDSARLQRGRDRLEPLLTEAMDDNVLEPAEENMIKNVGRSETELTDEEIEALIDEWLAKTKSIRGQGGIDVDETERLFFHQIKKALRGKMLSREEESELAEDAPVYNIHPERFNKLVLKALREIEDAERESTLEQDKQRFSEFYYGLLRDYGLGEDGKLPEAAREKLLEKDNSENEFFPLSKTNRKALVQETLKEYKENLAEERKRFYQEALEKLDVFEQHDYGRQSLLKDTAYELLLENMRLELIDDAIQEIIEKQSELFTEAAKQFYQLKFWHPTEEEIEKFLEDPNYPFDESWVRCDWLRPDHRKELFAPVTEWAETEYEREIEEIRARIKKELERSHYGLPVPLQKKFEADKHFHLSQQERREIIIEMEKTHRKKAEKEFTEQVKNNLVFETLIPDREAKLLEEGNEKYLLSPEKNELSVEVKTAKEIVKSLRKPFKRVIKGHVTDLVTQYKMDPDIVKTYELKHDACIAKIDLDSLIAGYKPKNSTERKTILEEIRKQAAKAGLHIIEKNRSTEFKELLYRTMEKLSHGYRHGLKKWFTTKFRDDFRKIAAAFGVDQMSVEKSFDGLRDDYKDWTSPKWGRFSAVFFSIFFAFPLLRFLISLTGYDDWIMASGPVNFYERGEFLQLLSFATAKLYSNYDIWTRLSWIFAVLFFFYLVSKLSDGEDTGVVILGSIFLSLIFGLVLRYWLIKIIIFFFGNVGILIANLFIYIWYILQNIWAFIVKIFSLLDYLLCSLPTNPVAAWTVFGSILALIFGFYYSTHGLRRSYYKVHAWLSSVTTIVFLIVSFFSWKEIYEFETRKIDLQKAEVVMTVKDYKKSYIREYPNQYSQELIHAKVGTKLAVLQTHGDWYKVRLNTFNDIIDGYILRSAVSKTSALKNKFTTQNNSQKITGIVIPKQGGVVRADPSLDADKITALPHNTVVVITGKLQNWYRIQFKRGVDSTTGFIYRSLLRIPNGMDQINEIDPASIYIPGKLTRKTSHSTGEEENSKIRE